MKKIKKPSEQIEDYSTNIKAAKWSSMEEIINKFQQIKITQQQYDFDRS